MNSSNFDPLGSPSRRWWGAIALGCLTVVCGTIGVWQYDAQHDTSPHGGGLGRLSAAMYASVQMLILNTPHFEDGGNRMISLGQWLGAGTLVLTTWALLWRRLRQELRGLCSARWAGHTVLCGLGRKGLEIVKSIRKKDPRARIIAIDSAPGAAAMEEAARTCVHLVQGDAAEPAVLKRARVAQAGEIIVVTPSDEANVRIASEVRRARDLAGREAMCFVHLSGIHLRHSLQPWTEPQPAAGRRGRTRLRFFDTYDDEARRVLLGLPIDGDGIGRDDGRTVHAAIIGQGRMGSCILLRAAKIGHFANGMPIRISVIDRAADLRRQQLLFRYPALADPDGICRLEYHQLEADTLATRRLVEGWAAEPDTLLHVFVCMDNNAGALDVGLRLRDVLAHRPGADLRIRINSHNSLAPILEGEEGSEVNPRPRIDVFGMVEDSCCEGAYRCEHNEAQARAIHDEFVRARLASEPHRAGEPTLRPWDDLEEDTRESNRQQADHIAIKLRAIGCEIVDVSDPRPAVEHFGADEIELLARLEHTRWNADRRLAGYRAGEKKDIARRIHNCIRPWEELSEVVREYDRETVRKIPRWLALTTPPRKVVRSR